jgi:hypothetical protein
MLSAEDNAVFYSLLSLAMTAESGRQRETPGLKVKNIHAIYSRF